MTTKEYFSQIKRLNDIIRIKKSNADELESALIYISPSISDLPHGSSDPKNKRTDSLVKMIQMKEEVAELMMKDMRIRNDAILMIESLDDSDERWVMYSRYFACLSWKDIISRSGYSERRIYEIHGKALKSISDRFMSVIEMQ